MQIIIIMDFYRLEQKGTITAYGREEPPLCTKVSPILCVLPILYHGVTLLAFLQAGNMSSPYHLPAHFQSIC